MTIIQWKRNPDDPFTVMEVPSQRATDIIVLLGGTLVGYRHKPRFVGIINILHVPDILIPRILSALRELKSKGANFDKE